MKFFRSSLVGLALAIGLGWTGGAQAQPSSPPLHPDIPIALLVDLSSNQTLLARNPDRRFVPASVTKVMTAYTAFELLAEGRLTPQQRFAFSKEAARDWQRTGSTMFLEAGDSASVPELILAITTVSANDGSIVLAEGAAGSVGKWVALMNAKARELGMRQSHFGTPNGWPDEGRTFTTARDLVRLGRALVTQHPERYRRYFGHRGLVRNGIAQDNHDPLTGRVEGADGIKTGFTNQAGYTLLGSAEREGRRLMLVIAGAPSKSVRDTSARALVEWGFDAFAVRPVFARGQRVGEARVQDGSGRDIALLAGQDVTLAMPAGTRREIALSIRYEGPLRAPIKAGEEVAELQIEVEGMPTSRVPLVAAHDIERAGFFGRIANALVGLFA